MTTKVAILGAGIGQQHLDAFLSLPDLFEVVLIVDKDVQKAQALAALAGCDVSDDIIASLRNPDIDIIDVCLPPHLHVPVTLEALEAGKHAICEKPVATNLADADLIRQQTLNSGMQFYPVFQYRWGPAITALRQLIDLGIAGSPYIASLETHWTRGDDYYAVDWRGTWAGEQGGAVLGHAIHNHDLLTYIMGPVASVSAVTGTRVNPIETEDCAAISFEMRNGAMATSSITLGHARDETRLRFVFESLTATSGTEPYAPGIGEWKFVARDQNKQIVIDDVVNASRLTPAGYVGMFSEIAKDLAGQTNTAVSLQDGYASIELVAAVYSAARSGQRVTLPLSKDSPLYSSWAPE